MQDKSLFEQAWLVVLGLMLVFFELIFGAITGFDIAAFGIALVVGGILHFMGISWFVVMATIVVIVVLYLTIIRSAVRKRLLKISQQMGLSTLVGKQGMVVQSISAKKSGKVLIDGEVWSALSDEIIPPQSKVDVVAFEDSVLIVVPAISS